MLWLSVTVDWSYRANRFELKRSNLLIGRTLQVYHYWLLVNLVMLIDSYCSMIVRFTSFATIGFLSSVLSLSCLVRLFVVKENLWYQGKTLGKLAEYLSGWKTTPRALLSCSTNFPTCLDLAIWNGKAFYIS